MGIKRMRKDRENSIELNLEAKWEWELEGSLVSKLCLEKFRQQNDFSNTQSRD